MRTNKLKYYYDKFNPDKAPTFASAYQSFSLLSSDDVELACGVLAGAGPHRFLLVHGLSGHHRAPGFREMAEELAGFGDVWMCDLRGHGQSSGSSTLGILEAHDVAEVVRHIKKETGAPPIVIGLSMGATAAVRAAALFERPAAVVAIGAPARWDGPRGRDARRILRLWKTPGGTTAVHLLTGVRIEPVWHDGEEPAAVAHRIAPAPLLVVHGEADAFFPLEEAEELYRSASDPKDLWVVEGGHAEGLFMIPGKPVEHEKLSQLVEGIVERVECMLQPNA